MFSTNGRRATVILSSALLLAGLTASGASAHHAYPGDVNHDGRVDLADLQAHAAATDDTVLDGIVANWNTTAPAPEPEPEPEPAGPFVAELGPWAMAQSSWGEFTPDKVVLGSDFGATDNRSVVWVEDVPLAQGADVASATIAFQGAPSSDQAVGGLGARVAGMDVDDAWLPSTSADMQSLTLTTARSAKWASTAAAWNDAGLNTSPAITSVIQEVVDRPGWQPGNDIALVFLNDSSTGSGYFPAYDAVVTIDAPQVTTPTEPEPEPEPTPTDPAVGPLTATGGRPFAADGPWNTKLPSNPAVDPNSAAMINGLFGNGGRPSANLEQYADPITTAKPSDPLITAECTENWGTCEPETLTNLRMPNSAVITSGTDGRLVIVQPELNRSCDFWQAERSGQRITASWATCVALTDKDAVGPQGGATGGNLNALSGVIRPWEIEQGLIPHALTGATNNSCGPNNSSNFRYPAAKTDGTSLAANCVPEGARLFLPRSIDVDALNATPAEKAIARALQDYGWYNRDNAGSPMTISFDQLESGEPNVYEANGLPWDYYHMPGIPWNQLRVAAASVTQP